MKKVLVALVVVLALLVIIPISILFFGPSHIIGKEQAKKELSSPASHFMFWRGAEIHYTDEGSGFPVLMIHGFGGNYTNFGQLAAMMKNDYRIVRIDLPGFGLSDFPKAQQHENYIQEYRDYLTFILDTLNLDSLYVIGNSMGGSMTWAIAAEHPDKVRKIVLLDPAGYDTEKVAGKLAMFKFQSVKSIFEKGMPMFMTRSGMERGYADHSKMDPVVMENNNKFTNREGNIPHMLALAASGQFPDSSIIKRVKCPTLIVWGKEDKIIPVAHAERFHRDIKNSRVIYYSPCGHMPMMERPADVKRDVEAFFNE